jgi:hypothetical protein
MANQQSQLYGQASAQSDSPSWPASGAGFGANGFDFGLSQPSTGLGPGLLGDTQTSSQSQGCADCQAGEPCAGCDTPSDLDNAGNGTIIKTQFPIPVPGLLPPLLPPQAQKPSGPTAGDPNAWWNKGDADVSDWLQSWSKPRLSEEEEQKCQDQYDTDMINCQIVKAAKGSRAWAACSDRAWDRLMDCRFNQGQKDITEYWRK